MLIDFLLVFAFFSLQACSMPTKMLKKTGEKLLRVYVVSASTFAGVSAASGVAAAGYGAFGENRVKARNSDGTYTELGPFGSGMVCGLVGMAIPYGATHMAVSAGTSMAAATFFPKSKRAQNVKFYYPSGDESIRGWNGKNWVCVDMTDRPDLTRYGYEGMRYLITDKNIIEKMENAKK